MSIRTYNVTLKGIRQLLMHWDNIAWADQMAEWRTKPEHKKLSKAGDDRSPAWTWIGYTYNDGERVALPADNLARCMMEGGAMVPVPGGRSGKTFKAQSQSGMMPVEQAWPLLVGGAEISWREVEAMAELPSFVDHIKEASRLGFELLVKRAKVGQSKHIRVRPAFYNWTASGTLDIWDDQITPEVLQSILDCAGRYKGLGDWRPGSKTPGPWGMFTAEVSG